MSTMDANTVGEVRLFHHHYHYKYTQQNTTFTVQPDVTDIEHKLGLSVSHNNVIAFCTALHRSLCNVSAYLVVLARFHDIYVISRFTVQ